MAQPADPMAEAKVWLDLRDITYKAITRYQIKIGAKVSYYPTKGTVFVDREDGARPRTGLRGLEEVLIELGYLAPEYAPTLSTLTASEPLRPPMAAPLSRRQWHKTT